MSVVFVREVATCNQMSTASMGRYPEVPNGFGDETGPDHYGHKRDHSRILKYYGLKFGESVRLDTRTLKLQNDGKQIA